MAPSDTPTASIAVPSTTDSAAIKALESKLQELSDKVDNMGTALSSKDDEITRLSKANTDARKRLAALELWKLNFSDARLDQLLIRVRTVELKQDLVVKLESEVKTFNSILSEYDTDRGQLYIQLEERFKALEDSNAIQNETHEKLKTWQSSTNAALRKLEATVPPKIGAEMPKTAPQAYHLWCVAHNAQYPCYACGLL